MIKQITAEEEIRKLPLKDTVYLLCQRLHVLKLYAGVHCGCSERYGD